MGVAGGFSLLVLAGVVGARRWSCLCVNGREFWRLAASNRNLVHRDQHSYFIGYPVVPLGPMIFVHALVIGAAAGVLHISKSPCGAGVFERAYSASIN
jgi:hypothetical protein